MIIPPDKNNKKAFPEALPLNKCLAKTRTLSNGKKVAGLNVLNHCLIVGEVARVLITRMPEWLRNKIFPPGSELVAAAHDIGKISPTFQKKIYKDLEDLIVGFENINPELEKNWGGHAGVSQITTEALCVGKYIPEILGQHHGYSPNLGMHSSTDQVFGGIPWNLSREELLTNLKIKMGCDWPKIDNSLQALVMAGLTTVSDWIGSSSLLEDKDFVNDSWKLEVEKSLNSSGFIQPKLCDSLSFREIFGFDAYDVQKELIENCIEAGVYVLEAPMGLGKTEAALYAAYQIMTSGNATGIYFALPTQLTSDKIHERVNQFLEKILLSDCRHKQALLLHGNAWLKNTEMGVECQPGRSWFQSGKRGILAPFAVGTIDQALMAVMNVKHSFVRTFGLAGKVVILDEVHSYDAYTGTILDDLVRRLRQLDCTVIILSATLTKKRRESLLEYSGNNNQYPLISSFPNKKAPKEIPVGSIENEEFKIRMCQRDVEAIDEALIRAESGQQVLWIENTVAEAQFFYKLLATKASEINVACGLLHSRFTRLDRENLENEWVSLFGKNDKSRRKEQGRILIGTQVLEQSLDIDSDFLVSRMCPSDMLLQRLGRLWRHKNTFRPEGAVREVWILSPTMENVLTNLKEVKKAFGSTALVYNPYILLRSLEVWQNLGPIIIPKQIRQIIESTYEDRVEKEDIQLLKNELNKSCEKLKRMALTGLSEGGKTLSENKASTRYNEQDTVEVLLIKLFRKAEKGVYVTFLDGKEIFLRTLSAAVDKQTVRNLSAILMENTVKVVNYKSPDQVSLTQLGWLKGYLYLGDIDQEESILRVAKVHDSGRLQALDSSQASASYELSYDKFLGYQAIKIKKNKKESP